MAGVHQLPNYNTRPSKKSSDTQLTTLTLLASASESEFACEFSVPKSADAPSDNSQLCARALRTADPERKVLSDGEASGWLAFRPPHIEHLALDTATQGTRVAVPYKRVPLMSNQIICCMNTLFAIGA